MTSERQPSGIDVEPRAFAPGEHEAGRARRLSAQTRKDVFTALKYLAASAGLVALAGYSAVGNNGTEPRSPTPVASDGYRLGSSDDTGEDTKPTMIYDVLLDKPDAGKNGGEADEIFDPRDDSDK